jgi:hypothetical protein
MPSHHPHTAPAKPTPRQQRYLRQLARQTGTSFTPPATKAQASREIERLEGLPRHPRDDRIREQRAVQADLQAGAARRDPELPIKTPAERMRPAAGPTTAAGERRELARYQLPDGTRAIVAQRINGRVAISDVPLTGDGRVYLIERHVPSQAELHGLVTAYVEHSKQAGCPAVVAQRRQLDELIAALA